MTGNVVVRFTLNNKEVEAVVPDNLLLADMIREHFGLTGTKIGCGMGECGACTILFDGKPVNSCLILACQANGHEITTIEGISSDGNLSALQKAFVDEGAVQCGFCTPGLVISATALLMDNPVPNEEEIRTAISGNLCRCTGYQSVVAAIQKVAEINRKKRF
ncbi:MAG TPA: (2Fe-2S)-binding protein [Candidatus Sumerlaeota bacterium]|nr:MAG: 4-hydroxybenzoyl-CoA reductase subunit gamma [candidate division BRC1 bacterium ADurb.Bin183]HOE64447.1 (2Fe-2S)-binding protein [Candidatus Sumerlaeota bacterium]HRR30602.1 (2Fe-2S)-binding protein [Candidatus Sumerlaeia bacterium]HON49994.1 (2Fe-2S)-binding protein [Candidatus Sumerlaeota bacterium]HOR65873.1 (2Fe-2S)-binding protein [Candidatus Sumerlaeota bacterium]